MRFKTVLLCTFAILCAQTSLTWGGPIPTEYQDAISKALPGFEILRNEDFVQDESQLRNFLSQDEISKRKKREFLGLIVGRFNNDRFPDFAAWVVNRSTKQEQEQPAGMPQSEKFAARLVVCLGTNKPGTFQCEILPTSFISLPIWADLGVIKLDGNIQCGDQGEVVTAFYPEGWKGKRPDGGVGEVTARKLRTNYDAIGVSAIGVNSVSVLVRGTDGIYLNCAGGD